MPDIKGIVQLPTADLTTNGNVRGDATASPAFIASVAQHGIIQPLVVRDTKDGWVLVAGHRRLAAAKELGLAAVPVSVIVGKKINDADRIGLQVAENLHREDLTTWELAQASLDLKVEGLKQDEIADQMGVSKKYVSALQKAGKSDITDEQGNQFSLEGLTELANAVKDTNLNAGDLANQIISGESRDMYAAVRDVQWQLDEVTLLEELAEYQQAWAEAGITVLTEDPSKTGEVDRHGYAVVNKNILRIQER
ncbi:unnamed protein product, partial [marine sediment metagenome]